MKRTEKEQIEDAFINGIVSAHQLAKDARKKMEQLEHRLNGLEEAWKHLSKGLNSDWDQKP